MVTFVNTFNLWLFRLKNVYAVRYNMTSSPKDFRVNGFVTAPFTPFSDQGAVDFGRLDAYIDHLLEFGCKDVYINGTTAECYSLTIDERKRLAEAWVQKGKGKLESIINHVTALSIVDAKHLAAHSEAVGCSAIGCMLPCYHKPHNEDAMVEWLREVAAAAPNTPFYYYDINFMSGNRVNLLSLFTRLVDEIPTLCGMKDSSKELPDLEQVVRAHGDRFQMLSGAAQYSPTCKIGVRIPVSHHIFAPCHKKIVEALDQGDFDTANLWEGRVQSVYKVRDKYDSANLGSTKAVVQCCGADLGSMRLPYVTLKPEEYKAMLDDVKATGFFEWCKGT